MKNFLKSLFSIEEHKTSVLIMAFLAVVLMGLWKCFKEGDIPDNTLGAIEFLGSLIVGGYAVSKLGNNNNQPKV